jgi:protein-S-isoprenylcysteine O-methyltransferase Ste14
LVTPVSPPDHDEPNIIADFFFTPLPGGFPVYAFFVLMGILTALGIWADAAEAKGGDDQPNWSAFFIDTSARRSDPHTPLNQFRCWLKVLLLFFSLWMEYAILFQQSCPFWKAGATAARTTSGTPSVKMAAAVTAVQYAREEQSAGAHAHTTRAWLCMLCGGGFVVRVLVQMFAFWSRGTPWVEVFAEAGGVIPLSLASFAFGASRRSHEPIGTMEVLALPVFLLGTYLNLWPEYTRYIWKLDPANSGKLYTEGLFASCRHINYFGEVLSFVGFAMASALPNLWVPAVMGVGMAVWSVPEIDFYLADKYGEQWTEYTSEVQCQMFPGVW